MDEIKDQKMYDELVAHINERNRLYDEYGVIGVSSHSVHLDTPRMVKRIAKTQTMIDNRLCAKINDVEFFSQGSGFTTCEK